MEDFLQPVEKKRGLNPIFLVGVLVGAALIGGVIYLLSMQPSAEEQTARILASAHLPGSPEFAELDRDIIIATDKDTVESPMGLGTISMFIKGNIKNRGTRTITVLEVRVAVVTQLNEVLRERKVLVVPVQQAQLAPGDTIPITLSLDGFSKDDDRANIRWKVTAIKAE
jgi:hypothetical protein